MAVRHRTLGTLDPVVYFINSRGMISLPPSTAYALASRDRMRTRGFELREAGTLGEIDDLQSKMQSQEYNQRQAELEHNERLGAQIRGSVRSRLYQRMVSSSTSAYERDFIAAYLQMRDEKKEEYQKRFTADQAFFEAREYNANSRPMQEAVERVPNQHDVECTRCRKYQRAKGMVVCLRCASAGVI